MDRIGGPHGRRLSTIYKPDRQDGSLSEKKALKIVKNFKEKATAEEANFARRVKAQHLAAEIRKTGREELAPLGFAQTSGANEEIEVNAGRVVVQRGPDGLYHAEVDLRHISLDAVARLVEVLKGKQPCTS